VITAYRDSAQVLSDIVYSMGNPFLLTEIMTCTGSGSPDQPQTSTWHRLVDHYLGASGVQDAAVHEVSVYIMEPHGARVIAPDAVELKGIALRLSHRHILEARGRFPRNFEKAAALRCWSRVNSRCGGVGGCAWPSCAWMCEEPALIRTRAIMERWICVANRLIFRLIFGLCEVLIGVISFCGAVLRNPHFARIYSIESLIVVI
jgi:hypothetical protein